MDHYWSPIHTIRPHSELQGSFVDKSAAEDVDLILVDQYPSRTTSTPALHVYTDRACGTVRCLSRVEREVIHEVWSVGKGGCAARGENPRATSRVEADDYGGAEERPREGLQHRYDGECSSESGASVVRMSTRSTKPSTTYPDFDDNKGLVRNMDAPSGGKSARATSRTSELESGAPVLEENLREECRARYSLQEGLGSGRTDESSPTTRTTDCDVFLVMKAYRESARFGEAEVSSGMQKHRETSETPGSYRPSEFSRWLCGRGIKDSSCRSSRSSSELRTVANKPML
ncbi:hypothetical protein B0H13DRAFT_2278122, partial [Mycena leptocephala]